MEAIKYAIYPSLLDAYVRFKNHDDDETFNSLFDKINKVRTPQTDQQLRGVAFEGIVNNLIDGKHPDINSERKFISEVCDLEGNKFMFDANLCTSVWSKLQFASKKQEYMEAIVPSHLGNIKLYGIADYSFPNMIVDLKSTGNYKCNKYQDNSQHGVYSLIRRINKDPLKAFKYLVTDFRYEYQETYIPNDRLHQKLMATIYDFINFIEHFKSYITDGKIFGQESGPINVAPTHHLEGEKVVLQ